MTYQEFQKNMQFYGYDVDLHAGCHHVAVIAQDLGAVMGGDTTIATVDKKHQFWFSMYDFEETPLKNEDWKTIQELCSQLASTPIDKRVVTTQKHSLADAIKSWF